MLSAGPLIAAYEATDGILEVFGSCCIRDEFLLSLLE